jgi:probable F420-dependent oxidoreductase
LNPPQRSQPESRPRFAIRIPSYAWPGLTYRDADALLRYCQQVEEAGFSGIWVIDHMLAAPALYAVSWLDPILTLSYAAAATERVDLGQAALVLPLRHPVLLAKELATLSLLSRGRLHLGIATGWDEREFEAIGVPLRERGARTDEALTLIRMLLTERDVRFDGKFFTVDGISIDPPPPTPLPVWVAVHAPETPDTPYIAKSVLRRILAAEGWISRSSGSDIESIKRDWQTIRSFLNENGRDPATLTFAQTQFVHIAETNDREEAVAEQIEHFRRVMGTHRSHAELMASYLFGTIDEIQAQLDELIRTGVEYMILTPLDSDPRQLDLLQKYVLEPLASAVQPGSP